MSEILKIDARGLACPQPVLETKKALDMDGVGDLLVLVDNATAKENVARFVRNQGCAVEIGEASGHFEVRVTRSGIPGKPQCEEQLIPCSVPAPAIQGGNVVYIGNDCMGRGDDSLGAKLIRGFLRTLIDVEPYPWRMIFINSGVKLTTIDEEAVDALSLLAERGVEILSCGTCLQHFALEDKLRVGKVTNMFEVIETLNKAGKVISPD